MSNNPIPQWLEPVIEAEFGSGSAARNWIAAAAGSRGYDSAVAREMLTTAQGASNATWAERRLAVLLLENEVLQPWPEGRGRISALLPAIDEADEAPLLRRMEPFWSRWPSTIPAITRASRA